MAHMKSLQRASISASSSAVTYRAGVQSFKRFISGTATLLRVASPPSDTPSELRDLLQPIIFGAFIASLSKAGTSGKTISVYLSGLVHFATDIEGEPLAFSSGVKMVLKGALRQGPAPKPLRPEISMALLENIVRVTPLGFPASQSEAGLWRALFTHAFFGCLRVSEYLTSSKDRDKGLLTEDVSLVDSQQLIIFLKKTKTNQHGPAEAVILRRRGDTVCPVAAMQVFLGLRLVAEGSLDPRSCLFRSQQGVITPLLLNSTLRRILSVLGTTDPHQFSSHSFRIGSATEAATRGAAIPDIMAMGRWRSSAVMDYLRTRATLASAARARTTLSAPLTSG